MTTPTIPGLMYTDSEGRTSQRPVSVFVPVSYTGSATKPDAVTVCGARFISGVVLYDHQRVELDNAITAATTEWISNRNADNIRYSYFIWTIAEDTSLEYWVLRPAGTNLVDARPLVVRQHVTPVFCGVAACVDKPIASTHGEIELKEGFAWFAADQRSHWDTMMKHSGVSESQMAARLRELDAAAASSGACGVLHLPRRPEQYSCFNPSELSETAWLAQVGTEDQPDAAVARSLSKAKTQYVPVEMAPPTPAREAKPPLGVPEPGGTYPVLLPDKAFMPSRGNLQPRERSWAMPTICVYEEPDQLDYAGALTAEVDLIGWYSSAHGVLVGDEHAVFDSGMPLGVPYHHASDQHGNMVLSNWAGYLDELRSRTAPIVTLKSVSGAVVARAFVGWLVHHLYDNQYYTIARRYHQQSAEVNNYWYNQFTSAERYGLASRQRFLDRSVFGFATRARALDSLVDQKGAWSFTGVRCIADSLLMERHPLDGRLTRTPAYDPYYYGNTMSDFPPGLTAPSWSATAYQMRMLPDLRLGGDPTYQTCDDLIHVELLRFVIGALSVSTQFVPSRPISITTVSVYNSTVDESKVRWPLGLMADFGQALPSVNTWASQAAAACNAATTAATLAALGSISTSVITSDCSGVPSAMLTAHLFNPLPIVDPAKTADGRAKTTSTVFGGHLPGAYTCRN